MSKIERHTLRTVTSSQAARLAVDQFETLDVTECDAARGGTRGSTSTDERAQTYAARAGVLCAYRVGLGQE
jgi:hypothetical protein